MQAVDKVLGFILGNKINIIFMTNFIKNNKCIIDTKLLWLKSIKPGTSLPPPRWVESEGL